MNPQVTIRSFLQSLCMPEYADSFEQNSIGVEMLSTLTADDLKELGVASLGHRKAILAAVSDSHGAASEARPQPDTSSQPLTTSATDPEPLIVCDTVNPAFIVEKVDKFKGTRMRISRYYIKIPSISRSSPP